MRKLLSFVIVAMMIVSMVVPAFALSEAPAAPDPAENNLNVWIEDAELNLDETNTVEVYVRVSDNVNGFAYMHPIIVYPKCLTLVNNEGILKKDDPDGMLFIAKEYASSQQNTKVSKAFKDAIEASGADPYEVLGQDPEDTSENPEVSYYFTSPYIDSQRSDDEGNDADILDNGKLLKLTFEYNPALNTEYGNEIPLRLFGDPEGDLHCYNPDYEWSDEPYIAHYHDGVITIISSHVHTPGEPVEENVVPATCTENGSYDLVVYCTDPTCKAELSRENKVIEAKGHDWDEWSVVNEPKCEQKGLKQRSCKNCDVDPQQEEIDPLGHDWGEFTVIVEPSPDGPGKQQRVCARCGNIDEQTIPYDGHMHDYIFGFEAPTATEAGYIEYTCKTCDFYEKVELAAYGEFDIAFEDITVNAGKKGDADLVLTNSVYGVDMLRVLVYWDESEDYVAEIKNGELFDDDCFEYAYLSEDEAASLIAKAGIDFDVEGKDFAVIYFEIADDSFAPILDSGVLATFTFKASETDSEFKYGCINIDTPNVNCFSRTGKFVGFIDYAIDDVSEATATIHYHTTGEVVRENVKDPTCVKDGSCDEVYYCTVCGEEVLRNKNVAIPASDKYHEQGTAAKIIKAPTADEAGVIRFACKYCGKFLADYDYALDAAGKVGYSLEDVVGRAGEEIVVPVSFANGVYGIDALRFLAYWDEELGEPVIAMSDEVFDGEDDELLVSENLSADRAAELLEAAGINFDLEGKAFAIIYIEAEDASVRTASGKLATITFTGPKGGGDFVAGVFSIDTPNVAYYGDDGKLAGFIDYEVDEIVPAEITVHDYDAVVTPPTCTEGGYTTHTCAHCGDVYVDEEVDALGHTPKDEWEIINEQKPDSPVLKVLKCAVCGEILKQETLKIDLKVTGSSMIIAESSYPEGTVLVDNDNRVINLITKKDQEKAVFRLKLDGAGNDAFILDDTAFAAGNAVKIGSRTYDHDTDASGIRYFISYAANGFNQSFLLNVTVDEVVYVYTVNVTFIHTPAVTDDSLVVGYRGAREKSIDVENKLIQIASKDAQTVISFNLKVAAGVKVRLNADSADIPQVLQYAGVDNNNKAVYAPIADPLDAASYNDDSIVYFKPVRATDLDTGIENQEFDIDLIYKNGETETYHVVITFNA